jgi:hypothetical protein
LINQLNIAARRDQLTIKLRAVCALQVDKIRLHLVGLVAIFVRRCLEAELDHCMLFRNAGMLQCHICNVLVSACKPTATLVQLHGIEKVFLLEDIHPPLLFSWRLACFCWLVVLENSACASDSVRFFG